MVKAYTVGQVNLYIKSIFTKDAVLSNISIKGEVSNCSHPASGHIYFTLKDESGRIDCALFRGSRGGLSFNLENGQQVLVTGSVGFYEGSSKVQLYAKDIILDGIGLLHEKYEKLKKELLEMGMFDAQYKLPIPPYAKTIGVVTSRTGAVIQDIIQVAKRRNPYVQIILFPATVQGDGAWESIVQGIQVLEEKGVDIIIVGRGGGSIEDLWAFNEEEVARAVFACKIPIISAVGHETDTTIIDYVADERAPTPSAAAARAVYDYMEVKNQILGWQLYLNRKIKAIIDQYKGEGEKLGLKLSNNHPRHKLNEQKQYLADLENKLKASWDKKINERRQMLRIYIEKMKGLSPLNKLNQGYSYVQNKEGDNISSIAHVKVNQELEVIVTDGRIVTKVIEMREEQLC
jgi:exodeoxyribonuclease VII large subunit